MRYHTRVYRILIEHNDEFEERFLEERFKIERFDNIRRIIKIECNFEIRSEIFEAILSIKKNFASNRRIGISFRIVYKNLKKKTVLRI